MNSNEQNLKMLQSSINGQTKIYSVIGNPVEHSFSPIIHNTLSKMLENILGENFNSNLSYVPFRVLENNLHSAIKGAHSLSIKGINVTVPHKKEVIKSLVSLEKSAEIVGTVNTLKFTQEGYIGFNTDYIGIEACLQNNSVSLTGKHVLIVGAGGSSYAAVYACAKNNVSKITIANRTVDNALMVANHIKKYYNIEVDCLDLKEIDLLKNSNKKIDIILQTSTMGFGKLSNINPIQCEKIIENCEFIMDLIYIPWESKLLNLAKKLNVKHSNGFEMLIYQAVASFEIWNEIVIENEIKIELMNVLKEYYTINKC